MVIEGGYWRDILAQPQALADTLAALDATPLKDAAKRCRAGQFSRVVLTGMGGSYWALYPMHLALLKAGWNSVLVETSELIHVLLSLFGSHTLLIVCSQSGRSAEIVRLLDVKQGGFTLAVTNTPDSPLADRSDVVVMTRAGEESTVSSKTYVTALMALQWMTEGLLGRSLGQSREELSQASNATTAYLKDWRQHVATAEREAAGIRDLFVLGRGASLATAGLAGTIIKESTHIHGEGMSAAAFRHGPWEMLHPALYALVMAGVGEGATLAVRLVQDITSEGARAAVAGPDAESGLFRLPAVPSSVLPIVEILPVQMFTLAVASLSGREAGKFERATKVTTVE